MKSGGGIMRGCAESSSMPREERRREDADTGLEDFADKFTAGAIRDLAHELDASVIALNARTRPDSSDAAMGSVASWATREAPVPVLTIRPKCVEAVST